MLTTNYGLSLKADTVTFDELAEAGVYHLGDPETVAKELKAFYETAGGFGTLLIVTGKKWGTREKVFRSMRLFMEHVAPQLRSLVPAREIETATA
jgi:alkanesulfonate monooxygenase SsuD/methylene tetrahydromethanopterin reductase-like flavin-dependent oxidoreductase (luciferase family)